MSSNSIWPIDRTSFRCYHSGPDWNREQWQLKVLHIPQNSSITGTSPSDFLVSYLANSLGVLTLFRDTVSVFYNPSRLGCLIRCLLQSSLIQLNVLLYPLTQKQVSKETYLTAFTNTFAPNIIFFLFKSHHVIYIWNLQLIYPPFLSGDLGVDFSSFFLLCNH